MMEPLTWIGIISMIIMLALVAIGVPIGFSMVGMSVIGLFVIQGLSPAAAMLYMNAWNKGTDFVMVCIPLFIFMGQMVYHSGIATDLFDCIEKWLSRLPGGLAITAVFACAAFGAVTGLSVVAVTTMGVIVLPEMKKYHYSPVLSTACLASAGTLAILIPPSLCMVVYGIMTDTSIGRLFIGGIIPGIIMSIFFGGMIYIRCRLNPKLGPVGARFTWTERFSSLYKVLPTLAIFLLVVGGIYNGFFTPTEASGIGASGVIVTSLLMGRFKWEKFKLALKETGWISAMVYATLVGGFLYGRFLAVTEITTRVADFINLMHLDKYMLVVILTILYIVLGGIMDGWAMLVLSVPFVFPIVVKAGIDPVWFGIFITIMTELGLITPPIGLNVYVIEKLEGTASSKDIFKGIVPFGVLMLVTVALTLVFPDLVLWLSSK
jgi:tripartite ATP-independent transporter DctM subunit